MIKSYVIDTNILIQAPYACQCFEENRVILPLVVLEELDGLKKAEGKATLTVTATQGSGDSAVTKTATVDVTVIKDGGTDPEPEKPVVLTGVKASVKKADLKVGETTKATAY